MRNKVLILGGTRFMGHECAKLFHNAGYKTVCVSRTSQPDTEWEHVACDRKNKSKLKEIFSIHSPKYVLDMICFDKGDAEDIVSLMNEGIMDNVEHYVMVSSFHLYNYFDEYERPFSGEIDSITDGYTKRKAEAEQSLRNARTFNKISIVRLPYVISHNDYTGRFQKFVSACLNGVATSEIDSPKTSLIGLSDAAISLKSITLSSPYGFIDVANSGCLSLGEIQNVIRRTNGLCDLPPLIEVLSGPYSVSKKICLSSKKLKLDTTIEEALRKETLGILENFNAREIS